MGLLPPVYTHDDQDTDRYPDLTLCLEIWKEKTGDRFAPAWSELEFLAFPADLIPQMYLVDVTSDPPDFRYRFFGTEIRDGEGQDLTGKSVDDMQPPGLAAIAREAYENYCTDPKPTFFRICEMNEAGDDLGREIIYGLRLPFSDDGKSMDHFLVIAKFPVGFSEIQQYYEMLIKDSGNESHSIPKSTSSF